MATPVYESTEIELIDGTEVTLKPLVIKSMRVFMDTWGEWTTFLEEQGDKPEDEQPSQKDLNKKNYDVLIKMAALCLERELKGERSDKDFKEYLEDTLDEQTLYRVLDVCGGLKLNDPNLLAAATAATAGVE